jgi:glycosyltransferase involved in cell wall biosynthesis
MRRLAGLLVGPADEADRLVRVRRVDPRRVHRVMNPVDTEFWRPQDRAAARRRLGIPDAALVAAWHGRVDLRRKGLDILVEAWTRVRAQDPDADLRLLLVGTGQDEAELRALIAETSVRGVTWLSRYAEPEQVRVRLAACDVWTSPSRHEGFAVAPLEAMASGRAVVLTDAPGARELVGTGDEDGGVVVPRGDAPALARQLLDLLAAPERRARLGGAARRRVKDHFSTRAVGGQLGHALVAAGVRPAG